MRIVYFTHSLVSCWNHGNAHFQRGLLRALGDMGHDVMACEPAHGWSRENLRREDAGAEAAFAACWPELKVFEFEGSADLEMLVDGADMVIVHEWNEPEIVAALGRLRRRGQFLLLFHDTHHRAVSDPTAMRRFDLGDCDGVLAFGEALAAVYAGWGWGNRVFVWHEAADVTRFHPPLDATPRDGAVWIGNWGDDERGAELDEFLLRPAAASDLRLDVYGVRYPDAAIELLRRRGAAYCGWVPNANVPEVFARHAFTVHVPRRFYARTLPGIPTIRVFEALACGIPLISAPWDDCESMFRVGEDFLMARSGAQMQDHMRVLAHDPVRARALAASGLARVRERHTCRHRAEELMTICAALRGERVAA